MNKIYTNKITFKTILIHQAERLLFKKTKKIKADKNYGGHEDDPCLSRTGK